MINAVTSEKKPFICQSKSAGLVEAITLMPVSPLQGITEALAPYADCQLKVVLSEANADEAAAYLGQLKDVEKIVVDRQVLKAFTFDSLLTYLVFRKEQGYEVYCLRSEPHYMW